MDVVMTGNPRTDDRRNNNAGDESDRYDLLALRLRLSLGLDGDGLGDRQEKSQRRGSEWVHVLGGTSKEQVGGWMSTPLGLYAPIVDMANETVSKQSDDFDSPWTDPLKVRGESFLISNGSSW